MLKSDSPVVFYVLLLCCVTCPVFALRGTAVVLNARAKAAAEQTSTASPDNVEGEEGEGLGPVENSTKPILTGIPQIDYIHDPNLPRELNGYNLSSYPFFNKVPSDITFKCDGLHDGFYASVPHKCQLYHHCLFGTRYDFLCANYTAFDQKSFICQYVSEVDCENSSRYFKRNDALYKVAETTTIATTTTTTTTTPAPTTTRDPYRERERERDRDRDYRDRDRDDYRDRDRDRIRDRDYRDRDRDRDYRDRDRVRNRDRDYRDRDYRDRMRERERERPRDNHRKRKPLKRRRPVYEYYYDDVYADEEYEDEVPLPPPVKKSRKVLESVKPVAKSSERDYVKPSERGNVKPIDRDYVKPADRDYIKPAEQDYVKPANRDSIKPADRDYIKPIEKAVTPSAFRSRGKSKYEEDVPVRETSRKPPVVSSRSEEYDDDYYEDEVDEPRQPSQSQPGSKIMQVIPASPLSVFSRPRIPPRINRPVPLNEKSKYEYVKNT